MDNPFFPPGTYANDPRAPWNQPDAVTSAYEVTVTVTIDAISEGDAVEQVIALLAADTDINEINAQEAL